MHRRIVWVSAALVLVAACSKATTTSSSAGGGALPTPGESSPAATSSAPSPAAESGGKVTYYKCSSLLGDREVQQATGLSDAAFFNQEHGEAVKGQTYCQFFAKQGAISIAVAVYTGPAFDQVYKQLEAVASQAQVESISGVGTQPRGARGTTRSVPAWAPWA